MHIVIVVDSKIPALEYGGTQRVVWYLGKELVKLGHKVTFLAAPGSTCDFADIRILNHSVPFENQLPEDTDIIHFNEWVPEGFSFKPYIVTYHGNRPKQPIDINAVFVSANHASRFGSDSFVYNGLDWDDYNRPLEGKSRNSFHFLGKAAWSVKNVRGAIRIIKGIPGEKLTVIGGNRLNFKMGFRLTLSPRILFKGMIGGDRKLDEIYSSKGLIFPVLWDEPFGLAVTESLYCGCPVFATPFGSLRELVGPEVGFLSDSESVLSRHIHEYASDYSPSLCRQYASDLFNSKTMALNYIKKYEKVLNGESLNKTLPVPVNPFNRYKLQH